MPSRALPHQPAQGLQGPTAAPTSRGCAKEDLQMALNSDWGPLRQGSPLPQTGSPKGRELGPTFFSPKTDFTLPG